ncbi:MFS transporter [Actinomadura rugatobispora]|uniref:MFS transporter n=1 Tax=Actinomadura rugatobispora TaxID=1994 RepID=A0ABW0ZS84_9ACTN|nr:MFS transporter [Actinomadura rugatobispora]
MTARDRRARLSAHAAFAVQGLCFASLVTRVPQVQDAHDLGDGMLALVLLLVPLIAGAGSVLAGALFPRAGGGPVLRVAQPGVCVAMTLVGLTGGGLVPLLAAVALFGVCVGAVDAAMNEQAVAVERRYGMSLLTGFYAVWSVAGILGGLWAALANRLDLALLPGFAVPAALGLTVSLVTGRGVYRKDEEAAEPGAEELKAAARQVPWRPVLIVGTAMGLFYLADAAVSSYSAKYLQDELNATDFAAPLGYVAYQVAMVAARAAADLGVRRRGAVQVVRLGGIVGLAGMIGVVAAPNAATAIAAFAVAGLGLSVVAPVAFSAAGRVDPTGLGVAVARLNVFNYVGFVLGAAIAGALAPIGGTDGLRLVFAVPAALVILIIVLASGFAPRPAPAVPAARPHDLDPA